MNERQRRVHDVITNLEDLDAYEESQTPSRHSPNRVQVVYRDAIALIRELAEGTTP